MKIRCPFCSKEKISQNYLASHIMEKHTKIEMALWIGEKIFKIHEKIEFFESFKSKEILGMKFPEIAQELKSLLENDKK